MMSSPRFRNSVSMSMTGGEPAIDAPGHTQHESWPLPRRSSSNLAHLRQLQSAGAAPAVSVPGLCNSLCMTSSILTSITGYGKATTEPQQRLPGAAPAVSASSFLMVCCVHRPNMAMQASR